MHQFPEYLNRCLQSQIFFNPESYLAVVNFYSQVNTKSSKIATKINSYLNLRDKEQKYY